MTSTFTLTLSEVEAAYIVAALRIAYELIDFTERDQIIITGLIDKIAAPLALSELVLLLTEARGFLYSTEFNLATIGTLVMFDEKAEDVKAALRLYSNALRTDGRLK